jgi:DNA-binding NtrC family response regulator
VLIEGESGTGKELVARAIHQASHRSGGPFVAVSCAALPQDLMESELFGHEAGAFTGATRRRMGRFEAAHGGTLFLDDVDDIPLSTQVKLLRVLQEQTFDRVGGEESLQTNVRVAAATKKSLPAMVASGQFRDDLYYRLNVVPLHIPPLRERREDVPLLVDHLLKRLAVRLNRGAIQISPQAVQALQAHNWPGNVRELEHVLERMVALSSKDSFGREDLPDLSHDAPAGRVVSLALAGESQVDLGGVLAEVEAELIRWALQRSSGNLSRAAAMLRMPRSTLQYKMSRRSDTSGTPGDPAKE